MDLGSHLEPDVLEGPKIDGENVSGYHFGDHRDRCYEEKDELPYLLFDFLS